MPSPDFVRRDLTRRRSRRRLHRNRRDPLCTFGRIRSRHASDRSGSRPCENVAQAGARWRLSRPPSF